MFCASDEVFAIRDVCRLKSSYSSCRHNRTKIWILSGAFDDAPPARVARYVYHGSEGPLQSRRSGLACCDALDLLDQRKVEAARGCERDGEDRPVAVDHVVSEQQRYLETCLLDRDALRGVDILRAHDVEERPNFSPAHQLERLWRVRCVLGKLADFLFQSHLSQQRIDSALDIYSRDRKVRLRRESAGTRQHNEQGCKYAESRTGCTQHGH